MASAGMTVRKLVTSWGYDVDDSGLKKMDKSIASMKSTLKLTLGIATAAAAAMFGIVKTTASAGSQAARSAQKVGLSTDQYQKLAFGAKMSKLEVEEFDMGLIRLNRSIYQGATAGGELGKKFESMGINLRDAKGNIRPTNDILLELSDKFKDMPNGAKKVDAAMTLMGRGGATMIPWLNKGSQKFRLMGEEAQRLGHVLSAETIAKGKEFNLSLKEVTETVTGLKNQIGAELLPVATKWAKEFAAWVDQNRELIRTRIDTFLGFVAKHLKVILFLMTGLVALKMVEVFVNGAEAALKLAAALQKVGLAKAFAQGGLPFLIAAGVLGGGYLAGRAMGYFGPDSGIDLSGSAKVPVSSANMAMPAGIQVIDKRTIHVAAPSGSDPASFGAAVLDASTPGLDAMLRKSGRDFLVPGGL